MPYLAQPTLPDTFGPFLALQEGLGFVPNIFRAQSLLPRIIEAEAGIAGTLLLKDGALSRTQKESILVAVAARHRSDYCVTAHSHFLASLGVPDQEIGRLASDHRCATLSVADRALLDFGVKLGTRPASIDRGDIDALHRHGWRDEHILEAVLITSLTRFLCTLAAGVDARPDAHLRRVPPIPAFPPPDTAGEARGPYGPGTAGPYLKAADRSAEDFAPFAFLQKSFGFIPNIFRAQTLRPDVLEAEANVVGTILLSNDVLPRVRKEYILLVISAANLNTYCVAVHCEMLRALGVSEETSDQIALNHRQSGLTEADKTLLDFALKLATRPAEFGEADVAGLREQGFSDEQILESVVMTALTNFLNTLQMGLGTVPDFHPRHVLGANLFPASTRPMLERVEARSTHDPATTVDAQLVDRAQKGEVDAFEELVKRHQRRVLRTLFGITGSQEDAEDCAQRVFLKAYEHLSGFRATASFSSWLTRIAINEGIERVRSRKPSESLDVIDADEETPFRPRQLEAWVDDPETSYARAELKQLVERELKQLPYRYRVAVLLRDIQQMSTEEAAKLLGIGIPTLKTHLLRGRLMLREALTPLLARNQAVRHA